MAQFIQPELKTFVKIFDAIARTQGRHQVFDDFLDMSINAWSFNHNINRERLQQIYSLNERHQFGKLIQETVKILHTQLTDDTSCYDVFGSFYEYNSLTNKYFGQFFTPLHVCKLMAQIVAPGSKNNFSDPCSGSARFSLAANSVNPGMFHSLVDIDYTCARMSVLNLFYHGIHGIVICDNALFAGKNFKAAFIVNRLLTVTGVPQIEYISNANEAYNYVAKKLGITEKNKDSSAEDITTTNIQDVADVIINNKTNQISLF